ncbi:MAG: DUF6644 family protein [Acidobacteriota bacterium]
MLLSFALWLQATYFFTELRLSTTVYPAILSLHLIGMGLFGSMIVVTDLRILGLALKKYPVADIALQLRGLKRVGFVLVITCGLLMLGSKAEEYYLNIFFRAKVSLLLLVGVHALVFHSSVYNRLGETKLGEQVPARAKLAAVLSLILWLSIMICGRGIGYIEPPLNIHAGV